jgi:hypothetical protein
MEQTTHSSVLKDVSQKYIPLSDRVAFNQAEGVFE